MIYSLSEGDVTKREAILDTDLETCYKYLYLKRVELLNKLFDSLETLKDGR